MNFLKQFLKDLLYQARYLFFRKYFGKIFSLILLYFSLLLLVSLYTYKTKDYKIYKGRITVVSIIPSEKMKSYFIVELKLDKIARPFKSFAISGDQKILLESRLMKDSYIEIYSPTIDLELNYKRRIHLLKQANQIVYKHNIPYKQNLQGGIFALLFAIWLFWISNKK